MEGKGFSPEFPRQRMVIARLVEVEHSWLLRSYDGSLKGHYAYERSITRWFSEGQRTGRGRSTGHVPETNSTGDMLRTFEAGLGKADRVKHQGPSRSVVRTRTQTADHIHQKTDPHLPSQKRIRLLPSMKRP